MRVNQCFVLLQSDESLLRATAKRLGVELTGKMHACTGCLMTKAYRKGIAHETKCRSDKKLGTGRVLLTWEDGRTERP